MPPKKKLRVNTGTKGPADTNISTVEPFKKKLAEKVLQLYEKRVIDEERADMWPIEVGGHRTKATVRTRARVRVPSYSSGPPHTKTTPVYSARGRIGFHGTP